VNFLPKQPHFLGCKFGQEAIQFGLFVLLSVTEEFRPKRAAREFFHKDKVGLLAYLVHGA
jgi:hypothetical protein